MKTHRLPILRTFLFAVLLLLAGLLFWSAPVHAEGSRELTAEGGDRPYTEWYDHKDAGVLRHQIVKVYAKAGETLYFGSSVTDNVNKQDIVMRYTGADDSGYEPFTTAPGQQGMELVYDTNTGDNAGYLMNREQEKAGPDIAGAGTGYKPLVFKVTETGNYEFEFHAWLDSGNRNNPRPLNVDSNDAWKANGQGDSTVAAWDVTVAKADGTQVPGRVFTHFLTLNMGNNGRSLESKVRVLTLDGFQYCVDMNGMDPFGFIFFANNRGLVVDDTNNSYYHSFYSDNPGQGVDIDTLINHDPSLQLNSPIVPDNGLDINDRIFFNTPDAELLESLGMAQEPDTSGTVSDFKFTGFKEGFGYVGEGGTFTFNAQNISSYELKIDLRNYQEKQADGSYKSVDHGIVTIGNACVDGLNSVSWDGRDADGSVLPAGRCDLTQVTLQARGGEVHLPLLDVENNPGGIIVERCNGTGTDAERHTIDYNNTTVPALNGADADQSAGVDSTDGAMKFSGNKGNRTILDVWVYYKIGDPGSLSTNLELIPRTDDTNGEIRGLVFYDSNKDGIYAKIDQDYPLPNVTVELLGPDGKTVIATTTTDISGGYVFTNVPFSEDAYRVQVVSPYPGMNACTTKDKTDAAKTNELQLDTVDPATPNVTNTDVGYYVPPETISIPVQKLWNDVGDTTARPGEIVVRLLKDGKPTLESLTLNAGNGWRGSFDNLLKFENGKAIQYTIAEVAVDGYTSQTQGDMTSGYTLVNTRVGKTSLSGTKTWKDDGGARPEVTLTLKAGGTPVAGAVPVWDKTGDVWTWSFDNLDKFDGNGRLITYTVEEAVPDGYKAEYDGNNITNIRFGTTEVTGQKIWQDGGQNNSQRPNITLTLKADGEVVKDAVPFWTYGESTWSYTFENLLKYNKEGQLITYTVEEAPMDGYTTTMNGNDITNTRTGVTSLEGKKIWQDDNDVDGKRPPEVTVQLMQSIDHGAPVPVDGKTAVIDEAAGWSYSFTDLPAYDSQGRGIIYTVAEKGVDPGDYSTSYDGTDIINTHPANPTIEVAGAKTWEDNNDAEGLRPESITVHLMKDGVEAASQTVTGPDWQYRFEGLEAGTADNPIHYTVKEDPIEHYTTSYDGANITNTRIPTITVSGTKTWKDGHSANRPYLDLILMANGVEQSDKTPEWSKQDDDVWTYEYRNLDKFDAEGKTITYTVTEAIPAGYGGYQDPENPFNFTNVRDEVTSLHGRKTWSDKNNQDGLRPESVTVQLMQSIGGAAATPVEGQTRVMSAENDWTYNFERIPGYDQNGDAIVYTVKEIDLPDGYSADYNGSNIVNVHPAREKIQITGTKTWGDDNDASGKRPGSVRVHLMANGVEIAAQTVYGPDWQYIFENLDKTGDDGSLVAYTVVEDPVPGYDTIYNGYNITNQCRDCSVPPEPKKLGSISGNVFYDDNWDKKWDHDTEAPVGNIVVTLYNEAGDKVGETFADSNGYYRFTDLEYGAYTVSVSDRGDGYVCTTENQQQKITLDAPEQEAADVGFAKKEPPVDPPVDPPVNPPVNPPTDPGTPDIVPPQSFEMPPQVPAASVNPNTGTRAAYAGVFGAVPLLAVTAVLRKVRRR